MPHALIAEDLSKKYTIGQLGHETMLREALVNLVRHPFRRRHKQENAIWALKNISFSIEAGRVVGLIGRNGAGKSTLLKVLSRITYPTLGTIKVEGRLASLLEVGTGFHEELTGLENIYLNGSILGMRKRAIDARLDEIVTFAGISKFIDTPVKRYSSGMRLRLGFAVAAHLETDILLVDEVLAVGDAEFQKRCLSKMENLHQGGRTVVLVSHNMAAIEHLCPRTLWIDDGQVRQDGPTSEVIRAYLDHFGGTQSGGSDLLQAADREGTGEVRIAGVEFLNTEGESVRTIRSNDPVTIRLRYRAHTKVEDAQFGITLSTELGTKVASVGTVETGLRIPVLMPGDGCLDATYQFLNLMPGRYWISVWTTGPHHYNSAKHAWDVLDNCATLDIEPSDFYGTGAGVSREFGMILLPCKWRVVNGGTSMECVQDAGNCDLVSGTKP